MSHLRMICQFTSNTEFPVGPDVFELPVGPNTGISLKEEEKKRKLTEENQLQSVIHSAKRNRRT